MIRRNERQQAARSAMGAWAVVWIVLSAILFCICSPGRAQFPEQAAEAATPEEFDAYLVVLAKISPRDRLADAEEFLRQYPSSGLRAHIFEIQMEDYRASGNSDAAIQAGEQALQAAPNNLAVLAQLAYLLANSTTEKPGLARAEELARREIEKEKTLKLPKSITPARWKEIQGRLGGLTHSALGLVAYKRGNSASAIQEFETAARLAPTPDPVLHYRLGLLYKAQGDKPRAVLEMRKAAASDVPTIRDLAAKELRSLAP